jgi:hypothetical protein
MYPLHNKACFYGEELLAPRPTPKLGGHPFPAVCDFLFTIFAATVDIGSRSFIRNLRTHCAVVTGTHLPWFVFQFAVKKIEIAVYRTVILPVVLRGCEAWSLTLRVFGSGLLRKVFGPKRES